MSDLLKAILIVLESILFIKYIPSSKRALITYSCNTDSPLELVVITDPFCGV